MRDLVGLDVYLSPKVHVGDEEEDDTDGIVNETPSMAELGRSYRLLNLHLNSSIAIK